MRLNIKDSRIEQLEEEVSRLMKERDELESLADRMQETLDDLKTDMFNMKNAMREAHDNYFFWGATHFFTKSAIEDLEQYY